MLEENKFIYSISFDPLTKLELKPNDYLFTIKDEIVTVREKTINQAILDQLQEIGKSRECSTLIAINEEKLIDLVRKAEIFDILNNNMQFIPCRSNDGIPSVDLLFNKHFRISGFYITDEIYDFLIKNQYKHIPVDTNNQIRMDYLKSEDSEYDK